MLEDYQLEPVVRALRMPRTTLLVADDVGLGKTIEAGPVIEELLLRHRARTALVACPAGLQLQWRDELREKFGLEFRIVTASSSVSFAASGEATRGTRLGEIALVNGEGRIGALETIFYDTLLDENAANHIAFERGSDFLIGDDEQRRRVNESIMHIDFMIGSLEMTVTRGKRRRRHGGSRAWGATRDLERCRSG